MDPHGCLQIVLGPMFSGKSSEVLRRVRRFQHARKMTLTIKYAGDTRYDEGAEHHSNLSTHDKLRAPALCASRLLPLLPNPLGAAAHVVAIDGERAGPRQRVELCTLFCCAPSFLTPLPTLTPVSQQRASSSPTCPSSARRCWRRARRCLWRRWTATFGAAPLAAC